MKWLCRWAWINSGWQENVLIEADPAGWIVAISPANPPTGGGIARNEADDLEVVDGVVLPALCNVHSHAFQWAIAGHSEFRTAEHDSFWTWRRQMFAALEKAGPDQMYDIALDLYRRMVSVGYTQVGEFHYVHTSPDGTHYEPIGLLARVLIQAALDAGIGICLLPALYQRGGFDNSKLVSGQRRFYLDEHQLLRLIAELMAEYGDHEQVNIGLALHSFRAVDVEVARRMVATFRKTVPHGAIHIHVAEQTKEVDDCRTATGKRPVELLLDELPVDNQWCLIHATHMTDAECARLAGRGAVVGLCPTTESNLGDGFFSAERFLIECRGRIAIGGDSHVAINPAAELRQLETSQRLLLRRRAILCTERLSCGEFLYDAVARGGAQALGFPTGELAIGNRADFLILTDHDGIAENCSPLDPDSLPQANSKLSQTPARILDRYIFCDPSGISRRVIASGKGVDG